MSVPRDLVTIVLIISAVLLILAVLVQSGKSEGLSARWWVLLPLSPSWARTEAIPGMPRSPVPPSGWPASSSCVPSC